MKNTFHEHINILQAFKVILKTVSCALPMMWKATNTIGFTMAVVCHNQASNCNVNVISCTKSYVYVDLLVKFYVQLPDQYLYVLVTPVETITYHPLNSVQTQHAQHPCAQFLDVLFDACLH